MIWGPLQNDGDILADFALLVKQIEESKDWPWE